MYTIKVFTRPFLVPFVVELIGEGDSSIWFECFADDEDHAIRQALNAHPDAEVIEVL